VISRGKPDSAAVIELIDEKAPDRVCDFESLVVSRALFFAKRTQSSWVRYETALRAASGREFPRFATRHFPTDYDREVLIRQDKSRDIIGASAIMSSSNSAPSSPQAPSGGSGHSCWLSARLLYLDCVEDLSFRITHYLESGISSGRYSKCIVS
jgi:hypothetical protein